MSRQTKVIVGLASVILVMGVAGIVWWILRAEGPAAVDLEAAVALMEAAPGDDSTDSSVSESANSSEESAPASEDPTTVTTSPAVSTTTSTAMATEDTSATTTSLDVSTSTSTARSTEDTTPTTTEPAVSTTTSNSTPSEDAPSSDTDTDSSPLDAEATGLAGVWTIVTSEGADALTDEAAVSFAGYRVVEVLAGGVDESTAVGRTAEVSGWIELVGSALVSATVEVEMATLRTDDSHRDSHARQSLNTKEFPLATFTLIEPLELPPRTFEGDSFSGSAVGDLTIKGITSRAVFELEAQLVGDTIVAIGSTEVVFSDYGVTIPKSRAVISVEDHGIMEFQLFFTR